VINSRLQPIVIAVSSVLFLAQVAVVLLGVPSALKEGTDFRRMYIAGYMVRSGEAQNLYDEAVNRQVQNALVSRDDATEVMDSPAYEALLFVPLSFVKYRTAYILFFAANLALLGLSIQMLKPFLKKLDEVWRWLPAAVFLCFFPVAIAIVQGQDSIVLLTLMVASAVSFYRGRETGAGVFLGLTLFKFQFAIPIALLFLFWRRWRMLAGFAATAVVVAAISLSLAGLEGLRIATHNLLYSSPSLLSPSRFALVWPHVGISHSVMPGLWSLLPGLAGSHISTAKVVAAAILCSILLVAWAAFRSANFALAVLVALLVSAHGTISDAVLLVIPIAMVLDSRLAVSTGRSRLWSRNVGCILFVGPLLCFLAGSTYCLLAVLMLGLLLPLRYTSSDAPRALFGRPAVVAHPLF
jgi:hypothetical protein